MVNKLELTWIGKDKPIELEPRILIENKNLSYSNNQVNYSLIESKGTFDNILIHGDNLLALKALEDKFTNKIKCIYIDPPYNTGSAFSTYDDNLEHSIWLNLMRARILILKRLLSDDGAIFISIDDREFAYLKILCDEIFGRENFVGEFIWQKKKGGSNDSKFIAIEHEYILSYTKNISKCHDWHVKFDEKYLKRYSEVDEKGRYFWDTFARPGLRNPIVYGIKAPDGSIITNGWVRSKERYEKDYSNGDIRIIKKKDGKWSVQFKQYLGEGKKPRSIINELATNSDGKKEINSLFGNPKFFAYPKPEKLIDFVIECNTKPGDWVLDSFLGSGTTAAVAQKMGRHWIGIELTDTAYTHCKIRIDKVINGFDDDGVTKEEDWHGGGGYKFYELAPSLIKYDELGEAIINPKYNAGMLASSVALHEGFKYEPDESVFWKQSKANENSYLFVTTKHLTANLIKEISNQMSSNEYLLIACKSYDADCAKVSNRITIKKIPEMLLGKCEFGKDNYNLDIISPQTYEDDDNEEDK